MNENICFTDKNKEKNLIYPTFSDAFGLRDYLLSLLDYCQEKNRLEDKDLFGFNKYRKITLFLGRECSFIRQLVIKEHLVHEEQEIEISVVNRCNQFKQIYTTEEYSLKIGTQNSMKKYNFAGLFNLSILTDTNLSDKERFHCVNRTEDFQRINNLLTGAIAVNII